MRRIPKLIVMATYTVLFLTACGTQAGVSHTSSAVTPSFGTIRMVATPKPAPIRETDTSKTDGCGDCQASPLGAPAISYVGMVTCDLVETIDNNHCDVRDTRGYPPTFLLDEEVCIFWRELGDPKDNDQVNIVVERNGSPIVQEASEFSGMLACKARAAHALPPGKYRTILQLRNINTPVEWSIQDEPPSVDAGTDQKVYRNAMVTVSGTWTDPAGSYDNNYRWSWDLNGDGSFDESGTAAYGETIVRTTTFAKEDVFKLSFQVSDNSGENVDSVQIEVINRAPYAIDLPLATNEKTAVDFVLPARDEDGDQLSFRVVNGPSYGVLYGTPPNLQYVPNEGSIGNDSFTFLANDGLVDSSNVGTVNIIINPLSHPPEAWPDPTETYEDNAVTIPVLNNDNPGQGDQNQSLIINTVSDPPYGSTVINQDGTITYYPDTDFYGQDGFVYDVCDTDGCATGTVTVQVSPVNDPPRIVDDPITVDEDNMVTFTVLGNDNAGPGNENQSLTLTGVSDPPSGWATVNQDGTINYYPDKDFSGQDSFTYEVCDSDMSCSTGSVTIQVYALSDAPSSVDDYVTTPPNRAMQIDVIANDFDADYNLDRSSTYIVSNPSAGYLTNLGNGWFEYAPVQDYLGSDSWAYSICDTDETCVTATVYVTVAQ